MEATPLSLVRWTTIAFTGAAVLVGCAPLEVDEAERIEIGEMRGEMVGVPGTIDAPRGVYVKGAQDALPAGVTPRALAAPRHRIIYMNRHGGVFTPGDSDSVNDRSSIVSYTSSVPAWTGSDAGWAEIMDCMREIWQPFDIEITDVDPGAVDHLESVVAGRPQDVGMGSGVGGVSPFYCGIIERSVVFTFAEVYGSSYRDICETAAQEVAHSFGMDHEFMCEDPMTYLTGCGEKSFQDRAAPCGEYSARQCSCGGSTQNSVEDLLTYLGPRPTDPDPPGDPTDPTEPDPLDPAGEPDGVDGDGDDIGGGEQDGPLLGGCQTGSGAGGGALFLLAGILLSIGRGRRRP